MWENAGQQREAFEALGKLVDCLARDLEDKASRCVSARLRVHLMCVCVYACVGVCLHDSEGTASRDDLEAMQSTLCSSIEVAHAHDVRYASLSCTRAYAAGYPC